MNDLARLQPDIVWKHFAAICAIPHPSYQEAALRDHLIAWADERGIASTVDQAGNLILRKPASLGCESAPGVILQGHLDMVCQANAGTVHDFQRDSIKTDVRDSWVVAEHTTLGADNGIGVALALAALEAPDLVHPALEVLLTSNEESGMDGARRLVPGTLNGTRLINLDTEEWGHFYLGCAGGVDVEVEHACQRKALPDSQVLLRFDVSGLRGGHSGIDIHLGRGNAIKLLAEALRDFATHSDFRLVELAGGSARNAIPREAHAIVALPGDAAADHLDEWIAHRQKIWKQRFAESDAGISFTCTLIGKADARQALATVERDRVLTFLDSVPNGVDAVSRDFPGVTETSCNLGVVALDQVIFRTTFKVRSLIDAHADRLADKLVAFASGYGLKARKDGAYPGWTPDPSSELLALCKQTYAEEFAGEAGLQVIHAGLECGLLAASHPHLDMISFGPDIRGAHAPGERVEIASVERCWSLLKALLRRLAA